MTFQETPRRALESTTPRPEHYERRDILTGTQQVIIDRDAMFSLNQDMLKLLRDIRKLVSYSVPAVQLLPIPTNPTVDNVRPVDVWFQGNGKDRSIATILEISGSVDFFYDFDRDASINSPEYNIAAANIGNAVYLIPGIQVQRLSILATAAGPYYINAFTTGNNPNANYICIRAWGPPQFIDDAHI